MIELQEYFAKLRDKAVAERRNSGIETQWREDEEFYIGVDDLNRGEYQSQYYKPSTMSGSTQEKTTKASPLECIHFLNMTAPFVDAASARCTDILLPANDWNFAIKPTPVPEFIGMEEDQRPMLLDANGQSIKTLGDVLKERNSDAAKKVRKAELHIRDWLSQSEWRKECRKVIEDGSKVGTGILKGPYPKRRVKQAYVDGQMVNEETFEPSTCRVNYWDIFPDMNCGENINDGDYLFERDHLYARSLLELKGMGYNDDAIDKVITEGPGKRNATDSRGIQSTTSMDDRYEVWYCYKYITDKDLCVLNEGYREKFESGKVKPSSKPFLATVMLINSSVIYASKWPLDDNGFPFDLFVWKRIPNSPFGIGVARQGRVPQMTILAAYRTLMNNQGLAARPMVAMLREALEPTDGNWQIYGGKSFTIKPGKGVTDIKQAISTIEIPSMFNDLSALIAFGTKSMEDATGITFLMQGQQGSAPDTVGGQQMMLQQSSTLLRRITRGFDECVESHIKRYYIWLLLYGPDDEKGDYLIEATGSSALLEREIQLMQFPQLLQLSQNPVFEMSPKKTSDEWVKAMKFDPSKFEMDADEKEKLAQSQQPQDPRIVVAEMNTQKDLKIAEQNAQLKALEIKSDTDRDAVFAQGVTERNQLARESTQEELALKRELAMLDYANKRNITLDKAKVDLAKAVMDNNLTKELAHIKAPASDLPTPPVEPPGTAPVGESFAK